MAEQMVTYERQQTTRHLKSSIDMNKRKIVESLFQAIRDKMDKTKRDARPISCLMLYGGRQLAASGKGEDGESPTESME